MVKAPKSKDFEAFGADSQIRTGDLILTKDALYLLSYISKYYAPPGHSSDNITEKTGFVNIFFGGGKKAVNTVKTNKQIRRPEEAGG